MKKEGVKLTEEQQQILMDNIPFVIYIAKKYFIKNDYIKNQDIIQEGILAMAKALPNYDSEKAKLTTYMYPTIDGHLKYYSRYKDRLIPIPHQKHLKKVTMIKAEQAKTVLSLDKEYRSPISESFSLINIIPDNKIQETSEEVSNKIILNKAIKSLEWKEKIVICYRFYFDLNQTFIGKIMGISQPHVHRIETRALQNIKAYLLKTE